MADRFARRAFRVAAHISRAAHRAGSHGNGALAQVGPGVDSRIQRRSHDEPRRQRHGALQCNDSQRRLLTRARSVGAGQGSEGELDAQIHSGRPARCAHDGVVRSRVHRWAGRRRRSDLPRLDPRLPVPQGRRSVPGARPRRGRAVRLSGRLAARERRHGGCRVPQRGHAHSRDLGERRRLARDAGDCRHSRSQADASAHQGCGARRLAGRSGIREPQPARVRARRALCAPERPRPDRRRGRPGSAASTARRSQDRGQDDASRTRPCRCATSMRPCARCKEV